MKLKDFIREFSHNNKIRVRNKNLGYIDFCYRVDSPLQAKQDIVDWKLQFTSIADCKVIKICDCAEPCISFIIQVDTDDVISEYLPELLPGFKIYDNVPLWKSIMEQIDYLEKKEIERLIELFKTKYGNEEMTFSRYEEPIIIDADSRLGSGHGGSIKKIRVRDDKVEFYLNWFDSGWKSVDYLTNGCYKDTIKKSQLWRIFLSVL